MSSGCKNRIGRFRSHHVRLGRGGVWEVVRPQNSHMGQRYELCRARRPAGGTAHCRKARKASSGERAGCRRVGRHQRKVARSRAEFCETGMRSWGAHRSPREQRGRPVARRSYWLSQNSNDGSGTASWWRRTRWASSAAPIQPVEVPRASRDEHREPKYAKRQCKYAPISTDDLN